MITLQLEPSEALIVLGALQDKQLAASHLAAISVGEEREIAELSATILRRVARRLTAALYPDQCRWLDDEPCERPIASQGLCALHLNHRAQIAEIVAS